MTLNRYAKRVDATQARIVAALRQAGVQVWVISKPCDLLTLYRGKWLPIECKAVKRTRRDQEQQTQFLRSTATPVCRTALEALAAVTMRDK